MSQPGQSVAPNFNLYTDVPIPSKFYGYVTDDVSVSTDLRSTALGEVQGVADVPVGLYDWTNRLLTTVDTDYNGLFEVLMPSTNSYNCPVPAGPCSGMYRFVGNDPGQPQRPNLNYNPAYRTIAANFQAWPGIFTSADTAPTRATVQIEGPGSQFAAAVVCKAAVTEPQLFRVDWPYAPNPSNFNAANSETTGTIEIYGQGFGAAAGSLTLTNDAGGVTTFTGAPRVPVWSDTHIELSIPLTGTGNLAGGAYQLHVVQASASGGLTTVNGLTIHVLKSPYTTVAANRNVLTTTQNGTKNLTIPALGLLLGQGLSKADVGAHITGSGIPAGHNHCQRHRCVTCPAVGERDELEHGESHDRARLVREPIPRRRSHRAALDAASHRHQRCRAPPERSVQQLERDEPADMFTPIDPNQFYFPGPIQKAINYGWDRYLNVSPLAQALINAVVRSRRSRTAGSAAGDPAPRTVIRWSSPTRASTTTRSPARRRPIRRRASRASTPTTRRWPSTPTAPITRAPSCSTRRRSKG